MASANPNVGWFISPKIEITKENAQKIVIAFVESTKQGVDPLFSFDCLRPPLQVQGLERVKKACGLLGQPLPPNFNQEIRRVEKDYIAYKKRVEIERFERRKRKVKARVSTNRKKKYHPHST